MKSYTGKLRLVLLPLLLWLSGAGPVPAQVAPPAPARPQILEFDRKFCPICAKSEQVIMAVAQEFPGAFTVRKLYIDEEGYLYQRYKVAIVPTQIMLDATGKEVFRHEGPYPSPAALADKLRDLGFIPKGAAPPST